MSQNRREFCTTMLVGAGATLVARPARAQAPSNEELMQPGPLGEQAQGKDDAPVTMIEYASMTCSHCANFAVKVLPTVKSRYIDAGKVRYILREFPIGKSSGNATIVIRCASPDKYLELYGKFMDQQASWVSLDVRLDAIYAVARQVGMTRPQFDACLQNQGMIANLKWVKERGRKRQRRTRIALRHT